MAQMTEKQKRFCNEYLIDLNVTQAAIRAGYTPKYADKRAYELLDKPLIKEYLDERMKDIEQRTEITQDDVVKEIAAIAFSNSADFFKITDKPITQGGVPVLDENGQVRTYKDIEFTNTDNLSDDNKKVIGAIKSGKYGLEVKLNDKLKALELLGRHLGMFKDKLEIAENGEKKEPIDIDKMLENIREKSGNN